MEFTTFNLKNFDATKEPMFFGEQVNVSRYDRQRYPAFEKLIEKQLSFFWRPEEVDLATDRKDFLSLPEHEKHIFLSNLKYQTLLDSIQGRSPNIAFLPIVSIPELETWIETWSFSETIHSRSYTHIIRNIVNDPSIIFDDIVMNEQIQDRAKSVTHHYDILINMQNCLSQKGPGRYTICGREIEVNKRELKKALIRTMNAVNTLEAIRFYVSFACSFAFAERALMEGNAKIIKLIARDEALHLVGTQTIINIWRSGDDDPEMAEIFEEIKNDLRQDTIDAAEQEKEWANYLFKDGSMIGLNEAILVQYVEYITDVRLKALGFEPEYSATQNPLPWMSSWLESDAVQVAPQEVEVSSYLTGQIDSNMGEDEFEGFDLT